MPREFLLCQEKFVLSLYQNISSAPMYFARPNHKTWLRAWVELAAVGNEGKHDSRVWRNSWRIFCALISAVDLQKILIILEKFLMTDAKTRFFQTNHVIEIFTFLTRIEIRRSKLNWFFCSFRVRFEITFFDVLVKIGWVADSDS